MLCLLTTTALPPPFCAASRLVLGGRCHLAVVDTRRHSGHWTGRVAPPEQGAGYETKVSSQRRLNKACLGCLTGLISLSTPRQGPSDDQRPRRAEEQAREGIPGLAVPAQRAGYLYLLSTYIHLHGHAARRVFAWSFLFSPPGCSTLNVLPVHPPKPIQTA